VSPLHVSTLYILLVFGGDLVEYCEVSSSGGFGLALTLQGPSKVRSLPEASLEGVSLSNEVNNVVLLFISDFFEDA